MIDDYGCAIAGYYLGFDRLRRCEQRSRSGKEIWRKGHRHWHICGIPEVLYTDNGSDFTSKHLEEVAIDLKVRLVFSTPGKPQGRGRIERFFRTVNAMFLCELDGYIRRRRHKPSLSLQRFEELSQTFLLETYHRRVSVNGRLVPSERWEEGGFLPRMPESLEQLDLHLMHEVRARKVLAVASAFTDLGLRCQPTSLFYVFMQLCIKLLHNWTEIVGSRNESILRLWVVYFTTCLVPTPSSIDNILKLALENMSRWKNSQVLRNMYTSCVEFQELNLSAAGSGTKNDSQRLPSASSLSYLASQQRYSSIFALCTLP